MCKSFCFLERSRFRLQPSARVLLCLNPEGLLIEKPLASKQTPMMMMMLFAMYMLSYITRLALPCLVSLFCED